MKDINQIQIDGKNNHFQFSIIRPNGRLWHVCVDITPDFEPKRNGKPDWTIEEYLTEMIQLQLLDHSEISDLKEMKDKLERERKRIEEAGKDTTAHTDKINSLEEKIRITLPQQVEIENIDKLTALGMICFDKDNTTQVMVERNRELKTAHGKVTPLDDTNDAYLKEIKNVVHTDEVKQAYLEALTKKPAITD